MGLRKWASRRPLIRHLCAWESCGTEDGQGVGRSSFLRRECEGTLAVLPKECCDEKDAFNMLTDEEAADLYEKLSEWLRSHAHSSLADDVAREIAIGRRVSRKVSVPPEDSVATIR